MSFDDLHVSLYVSNMIFKGLVVYLMQSHISSVSCLSISVNKHKHTYLSYGIQDEITIFHWTVLARANAINIANRQSQLDSQSRKSATY